MSEFNYEHIKGLVYKYLWKTHHERHFEDCVQFCSLAWFEGRTNVQWTVIDYCRINGIGDRGKLTAKTLEHATLVGLSTDENEDKTENGFLLDKYAAKKHKEENDEVGEDCRSTFKGRLEEFLLPFSLNEETFKWVKNAYRPKLSRTNAKTFNMLRIRST